ncbi:restriction endonuclease subunit R [Paenarthrobacter sp. NPDC057981]|uniref:restriction endonuclease subunit R n=1 Tax=Paenarthrobacter sp. NPDC057981 TaxID=3346297 RepID=UPI0036DEDC46
MDSTLPAGWTLAASAFNWTPQVIEARRTSTEIVTDIARDNVAKIVEVEPGLLWRTFPAPQNHEVDAFREALHAAGGRVNTVGCSLDDYTTAAGRRTTGQRLEFLVPQLDAAHRVGATGVRLPIGQAGPELLGLIQPVLHDLDLVLFEEIQGQQDPLNPQVRPALDHIAVLNDPRIRVLVDISMLMPALPVSYLEELGRGGVSPVLCSRLETEWKDPATNQAVLAALRSGTVPGRIHTLFMNLLIRFGRSDAADLRDILPLVGAFHLKFWDLDDSDRRVSRPIEELGRLLAQQGFAGTLTSEWGGHEWLRDDPSEMTRRHLALAEASLAAGAAREPARQVR